MMNRPPNFIILVGEDAGRSLGCYGDPDARTPHLDQLAAEGTRFENAFSTAPVCAPSRCALVSGQYAWSIGAHDMRSRLCQPPPMFTQSLRASGYHVQWPGKTDFNFNPPDDFADSTNDWTHDLANGQLPDQPFLLYHNIEVTHESTMWAKPWTEGHCGLVKERLARRNEIPPETRPDPAQVNVPPYLPDTPEVRADIARFYEALMLADAEAGRLLQALEQSPYHENTIVIYLTDHGRGLPREKRWCYGPGVNLSLVVRAPGILAAGSTSDQLVSWVDIAPTLLSFAELDAPANLPGRVFFGPNADPPRSHIFAGRDRMDEGYDRVRIARDSRFHYIRNYHPEIPWAQRLSYMERMTTIQVMRNHAAADRLHGDAASWMAPTKPPEELYDAIADPHMLNNLADDPSYRKTLRNLRDALDQELALYGDLSTRPEREHIANGLVENLLDSEYLPRVKTLPANQQPELYSTRLEALL